MPVEYALLDNKPLLIGALIVIEREISAIQQRHAKDATTQINATKTTAKEEDKGANDTTTTATAIAATVNENTDNCNENKGLL